MNVNLEYCNNNVLRVGSRFPLNNKYIIYLNNNVYLNAIFVLTFLKCYMFPSCGPFYLIFRSLWLSYMTK